LTRRERVVRRIRVVVRPSFLYLKGFWTALASAAVAVKLEALKGLTLGLSVGDDLFETTQRYLDPSVLGNARIIFYICRLFGVIFSFIAFRYIAIVSTSVRGSFMAVDGLKQLCEAIDLKFFRRQVNLDFFLISLLIPFGMAFQLFGYYDEVPMFIKVLFFPAVMVEWTLATLVSTVKNDAERFRQVVGTTSTRLLNDLGF
jgi:hypothetical protein